VVAVSLPLAAAAEAGGLAAMRVLLDAGADPDAAADPAKGPGGTPLQRACAAEAWEAARLLLERGASPNAAAPHLSPPLFLAAESGHAPTVSALLAKGANPNARSQGGATPIWLPVWNGHAEVVRLLLLAGTDVRSDRTTLLKGRPGQPVKPEIRKLLRNPPKPVPTPK
jgi:ankyrin repeat protein